VDPGLEGFDEASCLSLLVFSRHDPIEPYAPLPGGQLCVWRHTAVRKSRSRRGIIPGIQHQMESGRLAWVRAFCYRNDKEQGYAASNHMLRGPGLRLCWGHGLAAVGVVSNSCLRGGFAVGEQVSQAEVQFRARHALWLRCRPGVLSTEFDSVSRAQGAASRSAGENEMKASLRARNG
jgi:hypothetical protein